MKFNFKKIFKLLNPVLRIGGLEISDSAIRLAFIDDGKVQQYNQLLSPGIVKDGLIQDDNKFIVALNSLHSQFISLTKPIPVIVSLSSVGIYTQIFNLPLLKGDQLQEAANLNLTMISPIDKKTAYFDWQVVGQASNGNQEILGAFVESKIIDKFVLALRKSNFLVVAIEFFPLSLVRLIKESLSIDASKPYLVLNLNNEGVDFILIRNKNSYFNYFLPWMMVHKKNGGDQVKFDDFKEVMLIELRRVLNFYSSRWGGTVDNLILFNSGSSQEISDWLKKDFGFNIIYLDIETSWLISRGAALRGLIPRIEDNFISLAKIGTEEEFMRSGIWRFVVIWRNAILSTLSILLLLFIIANLLFIRMNNNLITDLQSGKDPIDLQEVALLENEARDFNFLLDKILLAQQKFNPQSSILKKIYNFRSDILINQLNFNSQSRTISLVGSANSESTIISFKNFLAKDSSFEDVSLPLSAITPSPEGRSDFSATFKVKR